MMRLKYEATLPQKYWKLLLAAAQSTRYNRHLGLRDKLRLLHILLRSEAAGSLLVHLGTRGNPVNGHVQHPLRPHNVRHDSIDVVKDTEDDVSFAELKVHGYDGRKRTGFEEKD